MAKMQQRALGQEFGLSLWMMEMDRRVPAREVTSSDFYFERNKLQEVPGMKEGVISSCSLK